jgi:ferredoxin-NADP reductase
MLEAVIDLGRLAKGFAARAKSRRGGGTDYAGEAFRDTVKKAVERIHPASMKLLLSEVITETPSTRTLRFRRVDGELPPFRAGQYVNLFATIGGVRTSRPLSISSAPGGVHLDLTVRGKPGGFFSNWLLKNANTGDIFESTGPAGSFCIEPLIDRGEIVMIAGGCGVTPFMSIIREAVINGFSRKLRLIYGCRHGSDVIFQKELVDTAAENPELDFTLVLSEPGAGYVGPRGFITADVIKRYAGGIDGKTFMVCGPNAMYDLVARELAAVGVPLHKVRRELYGPPDKVTALPGWPAGLAASTTFKVEVEGKGALMAKAGEPLLNSLERAGIVSPCLCRSGECSLCRARVVSGQVFMPPTTGIRESDRKNGYVHTCVSYPVSDLKINLQG